jgi:hypothetical protein
MLFSSQRGGRPGPKGPARELIDAVVEMKRRNPTYLGLSANCPANYVGLRRGHRQGRGAPDSGKISWARESGSGGPSWVTFLGQAKDIHDKDSLWSIDLFHCESLSLRTHWVLGGPVHAPHHRIWHSPRNCRWAVTVLDVPASDSRASVAEASQHGQRSVVSVPPMAGQPSRVGGDGIKTVPYVPLKLIPRRLADRLVGTGNGMPPSLALTLDAPESSGVGIRGTKNSRPACAHFPSG